MTTTPEQKKQWILDNKEKHRISMKEYRHKRREQFITFKSTLKCARCPQDHPATLQFHHLDPTEKEIGIAQAAVQWSFTRLLEEAEKCIVLCANCHFIEHYNQRSAGSIT